MRNCKNIRRWRLVSIVLIFTVAIVKNKGGEKMDKEKLEPGMEVLYSEAGEVREIVEVVEEDSEGIDLLMKRENIFNEVVYMMGESRHVLSIIKGDDVLDYPIRSGDTFKLKLHPQYGHYELVRLVRTPRLPELTLVGLDDGELWDGKTVIERSMTRRDYIEDEFDDRIDLLSEPPIFLGNVDLKEVLGDELEWWRARHDADGRDQKTELRE